MTIQQLQYALAVYKAGSISGAAASLYIAQPNLSGMIRSLEEELGYPIFVRTSRGVKPTDRGLEALRQAAQMVQCHEKMRLLGNAAARERFRLGGIPYPPACDAFVALCRENEELPQLELSYYCDDPEAAWDKFLMSELDMVLSLCSPEAGERLLRQCGQQGLSLRHLVDVPIVLRIGPNHPLYRAPEIHLSDFEGYTLVDYNRRTFLDVPNLSALMKIDPDRVITVSDRSMKYALISQGTMYALDCKLPPITNQRFKFRCIPLGDLHYSLYVIQRKDTADTPLGQRYLDLLGSILKDL